jgi:hypothetical protein
MFTTINTIRNLPLSLSLAFCTLTATAQNEAGKTDISIGVGGSAIGLYFEAEEYGPGTDNNASKAFNFNVDCAFTDHVSAGLATTYQQFYIEYNDYQWYNEDDSAFVTSNFFEGLSRTNLALRALYHLNLGTFRPRFDPYVGFRAGYSLWRYNHDSPDPEWQELDLDRTWLSYQVLAGAKFYINDHIGMHLDLGLGTPYLIAVGINYKFGTADEE